ncbi:MAG: hypothetical protein ABL921_03195 [Pirellula sp.]
MHESKQKNNNSLGFITVRRHPAIGFVGGYLIVNELARPLEFHCTLPVQPSRAQQILYGTTLNEFVCGEQIAKVLVHKAKCTPSFLLADSVSVLTLRHVCPIPLAALESPSSNSSLPFPDCTRTGLFRFQAAGQTWVTLAEFQEDSGFFQDTFGHSDSLHDVLEPFGRIEEALQEAHPASKAA